ncbi:MAG: hypothetical protein ACRC5M_04575 [Anaeroplasmataceae bacterium]
MLGLNVGIKSLQVKPVEVKADIGPSPEMVQCMEDMRRLEKELDDATAKADLIKINKIKKSIEKVDRKITKLYGF